jgi:uncharacterized protein (UPF0335 family)
MKTGNLKYKDILDVRDIIERVEELEGARNDLRDQFDCMPESKGVDFDRWVCNQVGFSREDQEELNALTKIINDLKGNGGDEQWRGNWYPVTLIRESHFQNYAQELADDIGAVVDSSAKWPLYCIDWEYAARELRMDYTSTAIDGVTYWYR